MKKRLSLNLAIIAALHDTFMAASSFLMSLYIRLGSGGWHLASPYLLTGLFTFTGICLSVFIWMRLYRGLWRYASVEDLIAITRAVTLSILIFSFVMFFARRLEGFPRSGLIINWLMLIMLLGSPRFIYRALKDRALHLPTRTTPVSRIPLLLVGASDNAEQFVRETLRNADAPYEIVGIADDRKECAGRSLHGIRIYRGTDLIPIIVRKLERKGKKPHRLILAEDYSPEQIRGFLADADMLGLTLGRLPRLSEFKPGLPQRTGIKPLAIEDLLGRAQTTHDRESMRGFISGKRVMVTGAGGSIGSELCRQIAQCNPACIILFEQSEYALYEIDRELKEKFPACNCIMILGDVRNLSQVDFAFEHTRPQLAFHAAAVKHVPIAELCPLEALETNVIGSFHIAAACARHKSEAMVMISTDKAVKPANIMGASKRLAEMVVQLISEEARGSTQFFTVRFGNVLGSTGSVVPLFQSQLEKGGPITVTHPDMVRYFMTIREAVELVIQAAALGSRLPEIANHIFVLDMGAPVKIVDLARQMIRLSGLRPEEDIQIIYTGLRPGEKLYEELFYDSESVQPTTTNGVLLARQTALAPGLRAHLDRMGSLIARRDDTGALALLKNLVTDYHPFQPETTM